MEEPLISIIIPAYNRAHLIGETLDSILAQEYSNWECIVVDDGSVDETINVVKSYVEKDNRFQLHSRPKELAKGANSCRNYGFECSKGELINWFDSDDIYLPDAFKEFARHFQSGLDAVVYKLRFTDLETGNFIKENKIHSENQIEDYFIGKIAFYVCGPIWRRSFLIKQKMLFDPAIKNLDDWDFNLRMLYANPKISYVDEAFILYRMHSESLSRELEKLNLEEVFSEFNARNNHLKLFNNGKNKTIKIFIKDRYKYFYKMAMMTNNHKKHYFFRELQSRQFQLLDITSVIKTTVGFVIFSLFKKGYKLL